MTWLGALYLVLWLAPFAAVVYLAWKIHEITRLHIDALSNRIQAMGIQLEIVALKQASHTDLLATVATSQSHLLQGQIVNNQGLHILVERTTPQGVECERQTVH